MEWMPRDKLEVDLLDVMRNQFHFALCDLTRLGALCYTKGGLLLPSLLSPTTLVAIPEMPPKRKAEDTQVEDVPEGRPKRAAKSAKPIAIEEDESKPAKAKRRAPKAKKEVSRHPGRFQLAFSLTLLCPPAYTDPGRV